MGRTVGVNWVGGMLAIVLVAARVGARFETWRTSAAARLTFEALLVAIALWLALTPPRP